MDNVVLNAPCKEKPPVLIVLSVVSSGVPLPVMMMLHLRPVLGPEVPAVPPHGLRVGKTEGRPAVWGEVVVVVGFRVAVSMVCAHCSHSWSALLSSIGGSSGPPGGGVSRLASRGRIQLLRRRGSGRGIIARWPVISASEVPDDVIDQVHTRIVWACHPRATVLSGDPVNEEANCVNLFTCRQWLCCRASRGRM